jgi:hypothetical protein
MRRKIERAEVKPNKIAKKAKDDKPIKRGKRKPKVIKLKEIGMEMDKVYTIISFCQINRVEQELVIDPVDFPVIENILRDGEMTFTKSSQNDGIHYFIQPPPEIEVLDEAFIFDEELENELKDDEQCF